jgi:hypothetical protein
MGKIFPQPPLKKLKGEIKFMRERTIKKQFWVSQNEDYLLKAKSKKAGLTEAEFLRSCIKGYKIKEQPTKEIRKFIKQVAGIANNINQIAIKVNINKYAAADEVKDIKNTIDNFIIDFQKKVYSRGDDFNGDNKN